MWRSVWHTVWEVEKAVQTIRWGTVRICPSYTRHSSHCSLLVRIRNGKFVIYTECSFKTIRPIYEPPVSISVTVCVYFCVCVSLWVYVCLFLPMSASFCLAICLSLSLSLCLCLSVSTPLSLSLPLCLSICLSASVCLSVCPLSVSVSLPVCYLSLSVSLSVCLSVCLSRKLVRYAWFVMLKCNTIFGTISGTNHIPGQVGTHTPPILRGLTNSTVCILTYCKANRQIHGMAF